MIGPVTPLDEAALTALAEAAEAALGCGMVEDCSDPSHCWYCYSELAARFDDARKAHEDAEFIAAADPPTVLALVEEVRNLRRWKREASEVGMGLQDLGRALDLRLGASITGPEAVAKAEALVEEVRALRAVVGRVEALASSLSQAASDAYSSDGTAGPAFDIAAAMVRSAVRNDRGVSK